MIYFKNNLISSIDDIYTNYSKKEFCSPFRSTIPLISLFKCGGIQNWQLIKSLNTKNPQFHFEYIVKPHYPDISSKSQCKSSFTDLMIIGDTGCVAVEAKRTEGKYETVSSWLNKNPGRIKVFETWKGLIENHIGKIIEKESIENLPYQLIHRVASSCSLKMHNTYIIYLCFELNKKQKEYYEYILKTFSTQLNGKVNLYLYCYNIEKTDIQNELEKMWVKGERDLSKQVIPALIDNNLMKCTISEHISI